MRIVLLGAPGSGKGTQAKLMAEAYRVPQVSTGDILRNAVAAKTEVGKKISTILDAGNLVPDDIVIDAVTDHGGRLTAGVGSFWMASQKYSSGPRA